MSCASQSPLPCSSVHLPDRPSTPETHQPTRLAFWDGSCVVDPPNPWKPAKTGGATRKSKSSGRNLCLETPGTARGRKAESTQASDNEGSHLCPRISFVLSWLSKSVIRGGASLRLPHGRGGGDSNSCGRTNTLLCPRPLGIFAVLPNS